MHFGAPDASWGETADYIDELSKREEIHLVSGENSDVFFLAVEEGGFVFVFVLIFCYFYWSNNFNWDIVDLECCVTFCCTVQGISYTYAYIYPFLDSVPIEVITEY